MANWIIALLFAAGVSTWVYTKFMRRSGNNSQSSLTATAIVGIMAFVVMMVILSVVANMISKK